MGVAADDPKTAHHERGKDRAFLGTILVAVALLGIAIVLIAQRGVWIYLGGFLFLLGLSFGAASVMGLLFRRKARRVLQQHEWVSTPIKVVARPRSGSKGRTIIELLDPAVTVAVSGLPLETTNRIEREGQLDYAGELTPSAMIFARAVDAEEVYIAVVPKPR